jgi:hypothetical protein
MLFDDISLPRTVVMVSIFAGSPTHSVPTCVRACYFDSILNAYCVRPGRCLADHLAERIETAT